MDQLDRKSPIPLYRQLKSLLEEQIVQGILEPGTSLPSERQLCESFDVSRTTVREALRELDRDGLIRTVPGRATFVTSPRSEVTINVSLIGFSGDVQRQGMGSSSVLLEAEVITSPSPQLIEHLKLRPYDEVVKIERLRFVNNLPLALHVVYLNHRLCPHILHHNLADGSLFSLLRNEYGLNMTHAEEQVHADLANQREIDLLDLSYPAAVLRAERTTYLDTGEVAEYALATYCGEWYRLSIHLSEPD
jgi:GntR family transcriptional regulator